MDKEKNEYPHEITIGFKTKSDRDYWLGQMSDGFGENFCHIRPRDEKKWDWKAGQFVIEWIERF
jgi:hypothetical protein